MKPASKRSTRSGVTLSVGPMSVRVSVFSGAYTPESPKSFCEGGAAGVHEAKELKSGTRYCPICSAGGDHVVGEVVTGFKASDGALVPISAAAQAERLLDVEPLRDVMDCVSVTRQEYTSNVVESSKLYWLTPQDGVDDVNYSGLVRAIRDEGLVLVTAWASRSVAKLYKVGVHSDMLTLTELVHVDELRESPQEPPAADPKKVEAAAAMFKIAAAGTAAGQDELARLAIDPGREALQRAADKARAEGANSIKVERGERATFAQRAAEADLAALLLEDPLL